MLPHVHDHEVLGADENIDYLQKQLKVLNGLLTAEKARESKKTAKLSQVRTQMRELRTSIRAIKTSLVSSGDTPSREAIRRELELETKLESLESVVEGVEKVQLIFREIGEEWVSTNAALAALPANGLTSLDNQKLRALEKDFKSLLRIFDYESTDIEALTISTRSYKPAIEDVDLGSEASASDNIRMIWAYLYGLMRTCNSGEFQTNHLGILIMDEPRQQEAKEVSFQSFIKVAAESMEYQGQVIIATSENFAELSETVGSIDANLVHFDGPLIAPLKRIS